MNRRGAFLETSRDSGFTTRNRRFRMKRRETGSLALWLIGVVLWATGPLAAQLTDSDGFINTTLVLGSYNQPGCDPGDGVLTDYLNDGTTTEGNILPFEGMTI